MRATTAAIRAAILVTALALAASATPAQALMQGNVGSGSKCVAGKLACVAKKRSCVLTCWRKGLQKAPFAVDPACVTKCLDKFDGGAALAKGCVNRREKPGNDCGAALGDQAVLGAKIDAHVQDLLAEVNPLGTTATTSACTSGKIGCVVKHETCVASAVKKAALKGGQVDAAAVEKCRATFASCMTKLEIDGDTAEDFFDLPEGCQTANDMVALRNKGDAFVDDVIAELVTGPNDLNTQRCSGDTSVKCTSAPGGVAGCGGPLGTCEFYFGSFLPIAGGGVAICVRNQWAGGITGTFDTATGESAGTAAIVATVFAAAPHPMVGEPCPRCDGDPFVNDGVAAGTCAAGTRAGLACDGNGQSPEPSFGVTSLDCPPAGAVIVQQVIDLANTTGTASRTLAASGPNCHGQPGAECLCGVCSGDPSRPCFDTATGCTPYGAGTCTGTVGEPQKTDACIDESLGSPGVDGYECADAGGNDEGICPKGALLSRCRIERFRYCSLPTQAIDCPASGDSCGSFLRSCFPGYDGAVGDVISASGTATNPRNRTSTPTFASVFCVVPTSSPAVNAAAGLPGPGRLRLGGVSRDDGTSVACPTQAAFLPTHRGGVLDVGWNGIFHDLRALSGAKVTVAVSGCTPGTPGNCGVCSYAGPIANANANP